MQPFGQLPLTVKYVGVEWMIGYPSAGEVGTSEACWITAFAVGGAIRATTPAKSAEMTTISTDRRVPRSRVVVSLCTGGLTAFRLLLLAK